MEGFAPVDLVVGGLVCGWIFAPRVLVMPRKLLFNLGSGVVLILLSCKIAALCVERGDWFWAGVSVLCVGAETRRLFEHVAIARWYLKLRRTA